MPGFGLDYFNLSPGGVFAPPSADWTNQLLDTEDFTTGNWTAVNSPVQEADVAGIAPDGGPTQQWALPFSAGTTYFEQNFVGAAGYPVLSFYVRWPDASSSPPDYELRISLINVTQATDYFASFNWLKGSDPTGAGNSASSSHGFTDEGDGWFRFYVGHPVDMDGDTITARYMIDRNQWNNYDIQPWGAMAECDGVITTPTTYQARGGS